LGERDYVNTLRRPDAEDAEFARGVDAACDRFEAEWRSGALPKIDDFLNAWTGPGRPVLLRELILLDLHYRRVHRAAEGHYAERFPEFDPSWLSESLTGETAAPESSDPAGPADTATNAVSGSGVLTLPCQFHVYELLEEIARGGMGVVFRARQPGLKRMVALKMILAGRLASAAEVRRFRIEAEAAARLEHDNIVPIYEVGEFNGQQFYSMRLIDGGSLASRRAEFAVPAAAGNTDARRRQQRIADIMARVARAVHYAHQRSTLHRDLKPANILLDDAGRPQVTDFGLSRRLDQVSELTQTGVVIGTPAYMAPEQTGASKEVTTQTDVYGLGAVMYELLTGRQPFRDARVLETLRQVREVEPVKPRTVCANVDRNLETICLKCLEKEPQRRYGSAEALADDLERFLRDDPIVARPANALERTVKWVRRSPARASLTVSVLLLIGLSGFGLWWRTRVAAEQDRLDAQHRLYQARAEAERDIAAERIRLGVASALALSEDLRRKYRYAQAQRALDQAAKLAAGDSREDLRSQLQRACDDLDFVRECDAIRMKRSIWIAGEDGRGRFDSESAPPAYRSAFARRGLDVGGADARALGEQIRASSLRQDMVAALDDWAVLETDSVLRDRILAVARAADPGPWLDRFRDSSIRLDKERFAALVESAAPQTLSPGTAIALAELMDQRGLNSTALLQKAAFAHPNDCLIPFLLGQYAAHANKYADALAHYRVARAVRPDVPALVINMSRMLVRLGDHDGNLDFCQEAVRLAPELPLSHYNLGLALFERRDFQGAALCAREAIRLDPNYAQAHTNLASALGSIGNVDGAILSLKEAIRINPGLALAHANLGFAYLQKGNLAAAESSVSKALRLEPGTARNYSILAHILAARHDYDAAIACHHFTLCLEPDSAAEFNNLGNTFQDKGDLVAAAAAYRESIRLDPKNAQYHINLGGALVRKQDFEGAVGHFKTALQMDPKHVGALTALGKALFLKRDREGALAAFRQALQLDPGSAYCHYMLGLLLAEKRERAGAISAYREAIRLDPQDAKAHYQLGIVLRDTGDLAGAIAAFQDAIECDPKAANSYAVLGVALRAAGDIDGAEIAFRDTLRLDPRNKFTQVNLGALLCDLRDDADQAELCFRAALQIDPKFVPALANLGVALAKKGNFAAAADCYREVIRLDPKHPTAQRQLDALLKR
jgi:eukaryotic-like serine/threonine-protein kinase